MLAKLALFSLSALVRGGRLSRPTSGPLREPVVRDRFLRFEGSLSGRGESDVEEGSCFGLTRSSLLERAAFGGGDRDLGGVRPLPLRPLDSGRARGEGKRAGLEEPAPDLSFSLQTVTNMLCT